MFKENRTKALLQALQDLVQIITNDFKTELREENHWLLFALTPVAPYRTRGVAELCSKRQ